MAVAAKNAEQEAQHLLVTPRRFWIEARAVELATAIGKVAPKIATHAARVRTIAEELGEHLDELARWGGIQDAGTQRDEEDFDDEE